MFRKRWQKTLIWIKRRLGISPKPVLLPFRGYGNGRTAWVGGRVMEDIGLAEPKESHGRWHNFLAMVRRYLGAGFPEAAVTVRFAGKPKTLVTDENGIFATHMPLDAQAVQRSGWQQVEFILKDPLEGIETPLAASGEVYFPHPDAEFGVISDVDDTILLSHSTRTVKKLRLMLTRNARTRLPFEGVARLYQALTKSGRNPLFFVSSSEWNLYDLLVDFCRIHEIPKAPLLLRRPKTRLLEMIRSGGGKHEHKLEKCGRLLETYPDLTFVLIGDSGQKDAELYTQLAHDFPGRIRSIYIRDIGRKSRRAHVEKLFGRGQPENTDLVLVRDSAAAEAHARETGLISSG